VSPGTGANDSYVEVQMYSAFQNFLSGGAGLAVCNPTCSIVPATFGPFSDVANGNNQDTVLFGDGGIPAGSKDFDVDLNLEAVQTGGAVCYLSEPGFADCVSWGTFSNNASLTANYGSSASAGAPAAALSSGMALRRSIAPGCPTLLEASDDTNTSATDFAAATPDPRKNSVAPTETPCAPAAGGGSGPAGYPPASGYPSAKKKCKKKHKKSGGYSAKKKKCKKRK
jgi:hypothetical protein